MEPDTQQVLCPPWRRVSRSAEPQLWLCPHLGNPDGLLRLPSHRDRPAQEPLASADMALVGFAFAVWQLSATQHVSCLSHAFGELGGEVRA